MPRQKRIAEDEKPFTKQTAEEGNNSDSGFDTNSSDFTTESDGDSEYDEIQQSLQQSGEASFPVPQSSPSKNNNSHEIASNENVHHNEPSHPFVYNPQKGPSSLHEEGDMIYDPSAYEMLHPLSLEWPALSFDWIANPSVPSQTEHANCKPSGYPLELSLAFGTQAGIPNGKKTRESDFLHLIKIRNLYPTMEPDEEDENEEANLFHENQISENDTNTQKVPRTSVSSHSHPLAHLGNDTLDDLDLSLGFSDPTVELVASYPMPKGVVTRVRTHSALPLVSVWSGNTVIVHSTQGKGAVSDFSNSNVSNTFSPSSSSSPLFSFSVGKKDEGWALEWGKSGNGQNASKNTAALLWGSHGGKIGYHPDISVASGSTTESSLNSVSSNGILTGHFNAPVEDIAASPTQPGVFVLASHSGRLSVLDVRQKLTPQLSWQGSENPQVDINVVSWGPLSVNSHLLCTGDDNGRVRVWDLRTVSALEKQKQGSKNSKTTSHKNSALLLEIANYHKDPINSISWSPQNESVAAVCSDREVAVYDFSVERDPQEELQALALHPHTKEKEEKVKQKGEKGDGKENSEVTPPGWLQEVHRRVPEQVLFEHGGLQYGKEVRFHPTLPGILGVSHSLGMHFLRPCNWRSFMQ